MPALIRRAPFWQRVRTHLDPSEFIFWLIEELNDDKYRERIIRVTPAFALSVQFVFAVLRNTDKHSEDDVFAHERSSRLLAWLHFLALHGLALICFANTAYVFLRKKNYNLHHQPIDEPPSTPNARRVLLDVGHGEEWVWQIQLWEPAEFNVKFFEWFSPVHVLLYYAFLPAGRYAAVLLVLCALSSVLQNIMVTGIHVQHARDERIIHGQVLNEYNAKFVQPLMHRSVRNVGVQAGPQGRWSVDAYSPGLLLNRGSKHINYTPTSYSAESGSNSPQSLSNGYTPVPHRSVSQSAKPVSVIRQRRLDTNLYQASPAIRYSHGSTNTPPSLSNGSYVGANDGEEIRVVTKPSPTQTKTKRQSLRPMR